MFSENGVIENVEVYKLYVLEVDGSNNAVSGVLSQQNATNELRPVAFFIRKPQGDDGKGQVKFSISPVGRKVYFWNYDQCLYIFQWPILCTMSAEEMAEWPDSSWWRSSSTRLMSTVILRHVL